MLDKRCVSPRPKRNPTVMSTTAKILPLVVPQLCYYWGASCGTCSDFCSSSCSSPCSRVLFLLWHPILAPRSIYMESSALMTMSLSSVDSTSQVQGLDYDCVRTGSRQVVHSASITLSIQRIWEGLCGYVAGCLIWLWTGTTNVWHKYHGLEIPHTIDGRIFWALIGSSSIFVDRLFLSRVMASSLTMSNSSDYA
jgi:hypothetical protein